MTNQPGVFCISVDTQIGDPDSTTIDSAGLAQRRADFLSLLQRMQMPSNWTASVPPKRALPPELELTFAIPKQTTRSELVMHMRRVNASMARHGRTMESVVLDPSEAHQHWDVLVRQGCHVARPRTATASQDTTAKVIRGGLWYAPLSCSFVGGSRRSVRTLFSVCQQRVVAAAGSGQLFHLHVDLGNARNSWKEEQEALEALLRTSAELRNKRRLQCTSLSQLPSGMLRKASTPMNSVLRRAA